METLLVFLAIAALQMIAAYTKQKKEAEKKAAQKHVPPPQATQPKPKPKPRPKPELKPIPIPVPEPELEIKPEPKPIPVAHRRPLSPAAQGFLWAAILQEPRYKVKWKQR